ncbi:TetR/AcrR family transcriptional regulator [Kitasatospora sp. NBC_01250]|uniref:helix-turn-helix domain-containing protein n=1 Tax=unclassified Kitasatospora TaxID=2633591 RepID=UPI002E11B4FD|nr:MULTISPECIES: helix-turn-helix domain-containing protein [unclassified Kitasatospora]WSJ70286.1 TetR/AcrR family transcriptional regulator [Kitasatospora sp. NBC_01302]
MRTRGAVLVAAAEQFDRHGYGGTSLSRISTAADLSTGALTFHFPTKDALADAVQWHGRHTTQLVVDGLTELRPPPLRGVVDLTLALAGLLERDVTVRAAARLSRERPGCPAVWCTAWNPALGRLAARVTGGPSPAGAAGPLVALARHLVAGVEVHLRCAAGQEGGLGASPGVQAEIEQIWSLLLHGMDLLK